jgi:hypothetical protein
MEVATGRQDVQVLSDAEVEKLAMYGKIAENHYGIPQDVEWGIVKDAFYILQSRPITTIGTKKSGHGASAEKSGAKESHKILVQGQGANTNVLLLGVQMGIGEGYLTNSSPNAHVALLESMQYTPGGGGKPVPDIGTADEDFIRRMLEQTRNAHPRPLDPVAPDLTDVRLYRIGVNNAQIGIHLLP